MFSCRKSLVCWSSECGQAVGVGADVIKGADFCLADSRSCVGDKVVGEAVEHALQGFVEFQLM